MCIRDRVQDKIYINKVGTFGIASAQYYWGRMAAIAIRLLYHIFPTEGWYFVYVDDFMFLMHPQEPWQRAAAITATLIALGFPLSWKKTGLGHASTWLGFLCDATLGTLSLAPHKIATTIGLLDAIIENRNQPVKQVQHIAGVLNWATTAFPILRPFLFYVYAWLQTLSLIHI